MKIIEITLRLLEALAKEDTGLSGLKPARKISFSKSTIHRALKILEKEKYVEKDPIDHRYRRGQRMLNLASNLAKLRLPGPYPAKAGNGQTDESMEGIFPCSKRNDAGCSILDAARRSRL